MWKTAEGSTGRLLQLCLGYFLCYVVTDVSIKYYISGHSKHEAFMNGMQFLFYSNMGGIPIALGVVLVLGWYRLKYSTPSSVGIPKEYLYLIPSGICTAVVIPTTTLMYTLPITIMVAKVIMRGSVIVISRVIDAIQIRQGILKKKVYWEENVGVVVAVLAVATQLLYGGIAPVLQKLVPFVEWGQPGKAKFDLLQNTMATVVLGSYLVAYAIRIYIMNYYRNTRPKDVPYDSKGFFGVEQLAASSTVFLATLLVYLGVTQWGWADQRLVDFAGAITSPRPQWLGATLWSTSFGAAAFFSVFLFIFKGRTATFSALANRLASLIAGTVATLIFAYGWGGKFPKPEDWLSLALVFIAVGFLSAAEKRRARELEATREVPGARSISDRLPKQG